MAKPVKPWNEYDPPEGYEWPDDLLARHQARHNYLADLFHPALATPWYQLSWLVQDLLPDSYLVMLAGPPKSGKTCLATAIALAVATGTDFAGMPAQQGAVLWLAGEESPTERNLVLTQSPLADASTPIFTCYEPMNIDDEDCLFTIGHWVRQTEARLLVVDPLLACIEGRSLQDSWQARRTLQALKRFCATYRITALVLHHSKRGGDLHRRRRVGDHDQLSATASMNIVLKHNGRGPGRPPAEDQEERLITLQCDGRGIGLSRPIHLMSGGPLDYKGTDSVDRESPEDVSIPPSEEAVLAALAAGPLDSEQILCLSGINASTARNSITNLRKKGKIALVQVQGHRRIYALSDQVGNIRKSGIEAPENSQYFQHPMTAF